MTPKKKKVLCLSLISLIVVALIVLSLFYRPIEGVYRSVGDQILLNDHKGYKYFKDGKYYSVSLSDELKDEVFEAGTYKKIGTSTYVIDCPKYQLKYKVKVGLSGLILDPKHVEENSLLDDKCKRVYTNTICKRIENLVDNLNKEEK